jgi:hypothetical protein
MKIEAYEFGRIVYGGKTYTSDLIIYPDRVVLSFECQAKFLTTLLKSMNISIKILS